MVHGDDDPWRKRCESYGFMMAKSMIMMNAEIHKERMKPENIYKEIGRDQWEYANEGHVRTGNKWNHNVMNSENYNQQAQNVEASDEGDDSLMRATGPSGAGKTMATIREFHGSPLTEENVIGYNEYSNIEVLEKEFSLGKNLLEKAIDNLEGSINNLNDHSDPSEEDLSTANIFFKILSMLDNEDFESVGSWKEITGFNEEIMPTLKQVPNKIEEGKFEKEKVDVLRDDFKMRSEENEHPDIKNLKEFLCEAFCLIEIIQELNEIRAKVDVNEEFKASNLTVSF